MTENNTNTLFEEIRALREELQQVAGFINEAYSGDCFWFVAAILGLDIRAEFQKVLTTIVHDLNLKVALGYRKNTNWESSPLSHQFLQSIGQKPQSNSKSMEKEGHREEKKVCRVYEQPFTSNEFAFWDQYGITLETLEKYQVKSLSRYESVSREGNPFTLYSSSDEPIFCYHQGGFVKIYRPYSKLRFLYGGEKLEDYVFGLAQLPNKGDVLFITGGEKDVLSLTAQGHRGTPYPYALVGQ